MANLKEFAEQLVNLTVKEVNELAQILKDEYGIEPAAASVAVAAVGGAGAAGPVVEEKTAFDVVLKNAGQAKTKSYQSGQRNNKPGTERSQRTC